MAPDAMSCLFLLLVVSHPSVNWPRIIHMETEQGSKSESWSTQELLTHASTGDIQTPKGRSGSVTLGVTRPGAHKVLFENSESLWWVWGWILNMISPLLWSCWGFIFALGCGVSLFGGIQHSPMVVQQRVIILEFSQEKMSTLPSTLPSCPPSLFK